MDEKDLIDISKKRCSLLSVTQGNDSFLGGPHTIEFNYNFNGCDTGIKIEQCGVRKIKLATASPIELEQLLTLFAYIEKLLMLFDGRFYDIKAITFTGGNPAKDEQDAYASEYKSRRLSYYRSDPVYSYSDHLFLYFDDVMSSDLLSKWISLQEELDIVHQVALYNIADTGITHDVKCANFIECFEPITEIIGEYEHFFPSLNPGDRSTTLKMCIDAVISRYGKDIFDNEFNANKAVFLQILINTRNRVMHVKRKQPTGKFLSGRESVLYLVKLCHLYRVVLLSLLGIDYDQYKNTVKKSVEQWDLWNGILTDFISNSLK